MRSGATAYLDEFKAARCGSPCRSKSRSSSARSSRTKIGDAQIGANYAPISAPPKKIIGDDDDDEIVAICDSV